MKKLIPVILVAPVILIILFYKEPYNVVGKKDIVATLGANHTHLYKDGYKTASSANNEQGYILKQVNYKNKYFMKLPEGYVFSDRFKAYGPKDKAHETFIIINEFDKSLEEFFDINSWMKKLELNELTIGDIKGYHVRWADDYGYRREAILIEINGKAVEIFGATSLESEINEISNSLHSLVIEKG